MVDNINLNKISPLLSSTERIKRVDRKPRNSQQSPFKGAQQGKQKKKKKKKGGEDVTLSEAAASKDSLRHARLAVTDHRETKAGSPASQRKNIIDIRV